MDSVVKYSGPGNDPARIVQNIVTLTGSNAITGIYNGMVPPAVLRIPFRQCGDTLTDIRNGQRYPTVLIGTQCWLGSNLNTGVMINLSVTPTNDGVTEKYCYNNQASNC
jgi:hypothetical protein